MDRPEQYVLIIDWQGKDLTRCVGPFTSKQEAVEWGNLNVVGGATAQLEQMAYPYAYPPVVITPWGDQS